MTTTAFPVRQDADGNGCTDVALRKIVEALYPNKGVISGLTVSGQNALSYKVAAGVACCSKGSADGNTLAYFEGGSVDVSANTSSNPRIDVVWITAHDITQGDEDNFVTIGVTQGTAAASPTEPSIPSYATKIKAMKLPGSASTTSGAAIYDTTPKAVVVPTNTTCGQIAKSHINQTYKTWTSGSSYKQIANGTFSLATKRLVQINVTMSVSANNGKLADKAGEVYSRISIDGKAVDTRVVRASTGSANSSFYSFTAEVAKGSHSYAWAIHLGNCDSIDMYYGSEWAGQYIQVVDLGEVD